MVKVCIALALVFVFALCLGGLSSQAQEPLPPAPGSVGTGKPLAPAPAVGQPVPGYGQMLPTWQALPPPQLPAITATPAGWYTVTATVVTPVYSCPSTLCVMNNWRLLPGDVVTVRRAGTGWLQLESGYLTGGYVEKNLFR